MKIYIDGEILEIYCKAVCKIPQTQCEMCVLRKLVDATQYKAKGYTATEAIDMVENNAESVLKRVVWEHDRKNGYIPDDKIVPEM